MDIHPHTGPLRSIRVAKAVNQLGQREPGIDRLLELQKQAIEAQRKQRSFINVATHFDTMAGRSVNDSPERMRERFGALSEFKSWMISLDLSYRRLLKEYIEFDPMPVAADAEKRP
jgi:hypothetical protein